MKRILIISTGGTISCRNGDAGLSPRLTFKDMIEMLPDMSERAVLEGIQLMNIDSANMQPEYWLKISEKLEELYYDYDGFVITHGTDTLSYTAAGLCYLIQNPDKPIVITGSQKPIENSEGDGRRNLNRAVELAIQGVGGVFVVFDRLVILGTQARKIKTKSNDAFISMNRPPAAVFEGDRIIWNEKLLTDASKYTAGTVFYKKLNTRVGIIKLYPGLEPDIFDYMAERYDALIIEAYGIGSIPFDSLRDFSSRVKSIENSGCILLVATQMLSEGTDMGLYEVGRKALKCSNLIEGHTLSLECALAKLMWVLAVTEDRNEIKNLINKNIFFDIA